MDENKNINLTHLGWEVADHVTAMLAYWDNNQICRFANSAYREWFGKSPDEMIGKITMKELLGLLYEKNLPYITGALKGARQVFEREIPLPNGGSRHTIATYYPDIKEETVRGFFVHVADVTPIKLLEAKVRELEKAKKMERLRSVIETRENEKENIAYELRDSVSQTLAYCKLMLQNANSKNHENTLLKEITDHIHRAIHDLNVLSNNLSPSGIRHFGLKAGLEDYIANFQKQSGHEVLFICNNGDVEELSANDKISIFRIVQNFLLLTGRYQLWQGITVSLGYDAPKISLLLSNTDRQFEWPIFSEEFTDIQNRIEYYEGSLHQINNVGENTLQIELDMTGSNNKV